MTTALEGGVGSASRPGRSVPLEKTRYPLYRRLGGPQGPSKQVRKISPQPVFDPRTSKPVASRYTPLRYPAHWRGIQPRNNFGIMGWFSDIPCHIYWVDLLTCRYLIFYANGSSLSRHFASLCMSTLLVSVCLLWSDMFGCLWS